MRNYKMLCLIAIVCGGLTLGSGAQKKPIQKGREASPAQNKVLARRVFEELTNQGRYEKINEVFDPSCKVHFGNRTLGLQQAVTEGKGWKSAAPDFRMNVQSVTENGDEITVVWSATGTHTGPGLDRAKPTGKRASMHETTRFHIKNGKIVEAWNPAYREELYRQLGISKTAASMFDSTEAIWAAVSQILPDPLYASLR